MKEFGDWLADLTKDLQENLDINPEKKTEVTQPKHPPSGELSEDLQEQWKDYYERNTKGMNEHKIGRAYTKGCYGARKTGDDND